jgi:hypothetical protein
MVDDDAKQETMQDDGVSLSEGVGVETTEGSRMVKQPTSSGVSTSNSRGPVVIFTPFD